MSCFMIQKEWAMLVAVWNGTSAQQQNLFILYMSNNSFLRPLRKKQLKLEKNQKGKDFSCKV